MDTKIKNRPQWTLVGKLLIDCADRGYDLPPSNGCAFSRLLMLDKELPIIRHKNKMQITRVEIYNSLWEIHGSKLISYFYNNHNTYTLLLETIYKEFPSYPKSPRVEADRNLDSFIMNTENVLAAITNILAYSCSEKKTTHLTSKSKSTSKEHYIKDDTYKTLQQMCLSYEKNNLSKQSFNNLSVTTYIETFLPRATIEIMNLYTLFIEGQRDAFYKNLKKLIKEVELISKRDNLLRKRVTEAADAILGLYLADKSLEAEAQHSSEMWKNTDYIEYKKTTGLKMKKIVQTFEKENPVFSIERMDFIRSAILDLNNFLKTSKDEKPIRNYREISKHIREYRNSESFYVLGKPFVKRNRTSKNR